MMSAYPTIRPPGEDDDFHDSSLLAIHLHPSLEELHVVLSTPDADENERLWMIVFEGVLRFAFETSGNGRRPRDFPVEIYSVYEKDGIERQRWVDRLITLGESFSTARSVRHIVLASSLIRGWGESAAIEGIQVVCRAVRIEPGPPDYKGFEFHRPRIEGG